MGPDIELSFFTFFCPLLLRVLVPCSRPFVANLSTLTPFFFLATCPIHHVSNCLTYIYHPRSPSYFFSVTHISTFSPPFFLVTLCFFFHGAQVRLPYVRTGPVLLKRHVLVACNPRFATCLSTRPAATRCLAPHHPHIYGGSVVRTQDWRPRGPGFDSYWWHFVSQLWQFRLLASVFRRIH